MKLNITLLVISLTMFFVGCGNSNSHITLHRLINEALDFGIEADKTMLSRIEALEEANRLHLCCKEESQ